MAAPRKHTRSWFYSIAVSLPKRRSSDCRSKFAPIVNRGLPPWLCAARSIPVSRNIYVDDRELGQVAGHNWAFAQGVFN